MKSICIKQGNKSRVIFILLGFLIILFIFFSIMLLEGTGKIPNEMIAYFVIHGFIIIYILYYSKKGKTNTFLGAKENSIVLWDIIKFSLILPFRGIKNVFSGGKNSYIGTFKKEKGKKYKI